MTNWQLPVGRCLGLVLLVTLLITAAGCMSEEDGAIPIPSEDNDRGDKLVMGVLPDENPKKITAKNQPLKRYLERELGREIKIHIPTDYASLVIAFQNDKVDVGYFGGLSYLKADSRGGAVPMVSGSLKGSHLWNTTFIASSSSGLNDIEDLTSEPGEYVMVFGDPSSTSGHLMPSYFLKHEYGVEETQFRERIFSGTHTVTALTVANDKADVGALNKRIFDEMIETGKVSEEDVNVIWVTPGYADYVWAANPRTLDREEIERTRNAFLGIENETVLDVQRVEGYVEVTEQDFSNLETAATEMGMLSQSPRHE